MTSVPWARGAREAAEQLPSLFGGTPSAASEELEELRSLPHGGLAPIPITVTAQQGATPPPVVVTLHVPRAAIDDIVAALLRHGGI